MAFIVGIDGGGTRTRVVIVDSEGEFVGSGISSSSNPKAKGLDNAADSVISAIQSALEPTQASGTSLEVLQLGLAGVRTGEDRDAFRSVISSKLNAISLHASSIQISSDLEIALTGGTGSEPGVVLVAGTGSAAFGRNEDGNVAQSGGWGWIIDDPGSGYWFGNRAMAAAVRAADGRGARTLLEESVRTFLGIPSIGELPGVIHNPHFSRERIAELAPLLLEAASQGDCVAVQIRDEGAAELALLVKAVVERLSLPAPQRVVLSGGVAQSGAFRESLLSQLLKLLPDAQISPTMFPPVIGAVCLAFQHLGRQPGSEQLARFADAFAKSHLPAEISPVIP